MIKTYHHKTVENADKTLNELLTLIVEGTWDWVVSTGKVERSPGWFYMLGYEVSAFEKDVFTWENLIHREDYKHVMASIESVISGESTAYNIEYRCKKIDGTYLWISDRAKAIEYNEDGTLARMIGTHCDIHKYKIAQLKLQRHKQLLEMENTTLENLVWVKTKELEKKNKQLQDKIIETENIANTDLLTKIANRKMFEEQLEKEISRSFRYSHDLSFVIFDIDFFKRINDAFGHKEGDKVLARIAKLVSVNIREIDFLARWGGEEFVLIFPCLNITEAMIASEKICNLISQYQIKKDFYLTCSFGVTELGKGDTVESLFYRADKALYKAKNSGRNNVQIYTAN